MASRVLLLEFQHFIIPGLVWYGCGELHNWDDFSRDQYVLALKNANDSLEEAQKQLAELDLVRVEKDRVVAELSLAKEDCQKAIQLSKQVNAVCH